MSPKQNPEEPHAQLFPCPIEDLVNWQTAIQLFVFYYANKILTNLIYSLLLHKIPTSKSTVHD